MSRKVPTSLLLKPDKSFCAFGSEAETMYTQMAEGKDSDSDSDSDSEVNGKKQKAASCKNCSDYYYFNRFKMLLHENKVSIKYKLKMYRRDYKMNIFFYKYTCIT